MKLRTSREPTPHQIQPFPCHPFQLCLLSLSHVPCHSELLLGSDQVFFACFSLCCWGILYLFKDVPSPLKIFWHPPPPPPVFQQSWGAPPLPSLLLHKPLWMLLHPVLPIGVERSLPHLLRQGCVSLSLESSEPKLVAGTEQAFGK